MSDKAVQWRDAIESLSAVINEIDPLYPPAEFLLGYTYLTQGDAQKAEGVFQRLVDRFEDQLSQGVGELEQTWVKAGLRGLRIGKRIPFVVDWIKYYSDALILLGGGELCRGAKTWEALKQELAGANQTSCSQRRRTA
jgi:tetratricopeptide (TPR) repeat protein